MSARQPSLFSGRLSERTRLPPISVRSRVKEGSSSDENGTGRQVPIASSPSRATRTAA